MEFSEGSVLFIMPAMLMARASAGHQMLMREIEQRYRETRGGGGETRRMTSTLLDASDTYRGESSPGVRWNKVRFLATVSLGARAGRDNGFIWPLGCLFVCFLFSSTSYRQRANPK